ncbi:hypothetical protein ACF0H5_010155 [Mactra antiquata]
MNELQYNHVISENRQMAEDDRRYLKLKSQPEILVKAKKDTYPCDITGSSYVPYDNLVVADYPNKSIKLLNTTYCNIKSVYMLEHEPWGVAYNSENGEVGVTVPREGKIYCFRLKITGEIVLSRTIKVKTQCRGIAFSKECIILTYGHYKLNIPGKIEFIDMHGEVLRSIKKSETGDHLFGYPSHVALSLDNTKLYVSDFRKATVSAINIDGMEANEQSKAFILKCVHILQDPRGITIDGAGNVYVCDYYHGDVSIFNDKLELVHTIDGHGHGIVYPRTIDFDHRHNKLFVGMFYNNFIKIFELGSTKWEYDNKAFIC